MRPNGRILERSDDRELRYKDVYTLNISGKDAVGWMMTIYTLMSERRQQKIKILLSAWKTNTLRQEKITGRRAEIRSFYNKLARRYKISWPEVRRRLQRGDITSD